MKKRFLFNYTRATQFRDSFIKVVDLQTKSTTTYLEERFLGEGGFGRVRLFTDGNQQFAVKAPAPPEVGVNDDDVQYKIAAIENERDMMEAAYPDDFYSLSTYKQTISNDETEVDYRFIMPFVKGMAVYQFMDFMNSEREFAKLILRISQEVLRINRAGIIHCDTNLSNIFVVKKNHDYYIHLIDFGISVKIGETNVDFQRLIYGSLPRVETQVITTPISSEHQLEIFATTLKSLRWRYRGPLQKSNVLDSFPSIRKFIEKGKQPALSERQPLTTFIAALSLEILNLDTSAPLKKVCSALFNHRDKLLKKRLRNDANNDAFGLLPKLIRHHFYRELKMMLEAKEDLLNVSIPELKKLFAQIARDQHFPPNLLREIFVFHIPTDKLKDLLTDPVQDDTTLLHIAFENDQSEIVSILFQRLAKLFPETKIEEIGENLHKLDRLRQQDKKTVIDLVIHILHLYLDNENLPAADPNRFFGHNHKNAPYDIAHRIASCESLFQRMMPGDDPFQKIREDVYIPLLKHFNLKSHSKKYHDDVLRNIYGRMLGQHVESRPKHIHINHRP